MRGVERGRCGGAAGRRTKLIFGAYSVRPAPLSIVPGHCLPPVSALLSASELCVPRASVPIARPMSCRSAASNVAPSETPLGKAVASASFTPCWSSLRYE